MSDQRSANSSSGKFVDKLDMLSDTVASYVLNIGAELLGKKWRAVILYHLNYGPKRFSELKRLIPGVSVKVLSQVLKEMEGNKLIVRSQDNSCIPVKVMYNIHPHAEGLMHATIVATVCFAEHALQNTKDLHIPSHMAEEIRQWLSAHHPH